MMASMAASKTAAGSFARPTEIGKAVETLELSDRHGEEPLSPSRSVMSRTILEAPTISPSAFFTGETVSEIFTRRPSLARRTVSK
jgi:hypothetical protein